MRELLYNSGKTEWEDILIKHKIIAAPDVPPTDDELQLDYQQRHQLKDELDGKTLDELNELEDDLDETVLETYR